MKKRLLAWITLLCMAVLLALPAGAVTAAANGGEVQTIRALGIMTGDGQGNLNLGANVTRAQFAKMTVNASQYKDTVGDGEGVSLFKDVKSNHWASQYIKIAVDEGWMTGYSDGTFRPDQTITLEQACTTVLRLLGYDASAMAGSFPSAQLSKAAALGLRDQISLGKGGVMTRSDCVYLFYNALTAQTSGGQTYASTLGYTVTNGQVDYSSAVSANLSGPYVAAGNRLELPFTPAAVYRNGAVSSLASVSALDVYYYNEGLQTVWLYTDRAGGVITALEPNAASPTSVTVGGKAYSIGTAAASYKLSAMGGFQVGDTALLLLGMNGEVVDVAEGSAAATVYYGVVASASYQNTSASGNITVQTSVNVACTDGAVHTFSLDRSDVGFTAGELVSVSVDGKGTTINRLSAKTLSGKVDAAGTALGERKFASDVRILDSTATGGYAKIYPGRLAGYTLQSGDVRYYVLNTAGEIEQLILNDATGDAWTFGYLTNAPEIENGSLSGSYEIIVNGDSRTLNNNGVKFSVGTGGAAYQLKTDGATVKTIRNLAKVTLSTLSALTAEGGGVSYPVDDNVQVYLRQDGKTYATTLSAVNTVDYTLTGWYDNFGCTCGGRIRVITAVPK